MVYRYFLGVAPHKTIITFWDLGRMFWEWDRPFFGSPFGLFFDNVANEFPETCLRILRYSLNHSLMNHLELPFKNLLGQLYSEFLGRTWPSTAVPQIYLCPLNVKQSSISRKFLPPSVGL